MNRRSFLTSLPFLPSAVKAVAAAVSIPESGTYKCDARSLNHAISDYQRWVDQQMGNPKLTTRWLQTKRTTLYASPAYLEAVGRITYDPTYLFPAGFETGRFQPS